MAPWRRASSSSAAPVASSDPARSVVGCNSRVSPEISSAEDGDEEEGEGTWSALVPELLNDIMRRVHAGAERWPRRRDVVACAGVCRRWREASVKFVRPPLEGGGITFPSSLKLVRLPLRYSCFGFAHAIPAPHLFFGQKTK